MNISALKYRDFRIYLGGNIFALNALWMQRVTIGWIAWDMTSSASFVGFVAFMNFAPTMLTSPFFGVLADRINVRHGALLTQSLQILLGLVLFAGFMLGYLGPFSLAVLSAVLGVVAAAHNPIRMSLAPRLVERSAVGSVVSIVAINFNLARMTGPAIGGAVISTWGVGVSLLMQTVLILPFILAIWILRPRERQSATPKGEHFLTSLMIGLRHVWQTPLILHALLITGLFAFIIRGTLEILPVLADGVFDKGAGGLGLLTSCAGVGAVGAAFTKALMPVQANGRLPMPALLSAVLGTALVTFLGYSTVWELTLALITCVAFCGTLSGVSMQTAIQIDLDDHLRGRVMSLWVMVGIGSAATGAIVLGTLADQFGFALALSATGSVALAVIATLVVRIWRQ